MTEIIRIGVANARIKCVTPQRVEYFDEAGQECFVDLEECARDWVQLHGDRRGRKYRHVAGRGLIGDPPWVEFTNKRPTRFEFGSSGEGYELKHLLLKARWITMDWL
jgi:hypothetical protein